MPGYNYTEGSDLKQSTDIESAVRESIFNYFHKQLGWSRKHCERRVRMELDRVIPKDLFDKVERRRGWQLNNARLIDVGAGQGGSVLEALVRGGDAVGVEPGPEFAELSRMRLREAGFDPERIKKTGGGSLPFDSNSFDYAICIQVLEHVEDPGSILGEIYRVLEPGGGKL